MEIFSTTERGQERHHTTCDVCDGPVYPNHDNPHLFRGFKCMDTGMFIGTDCKEAYYKAKNAGKYGAQHAHKYSEFPVAVPWKIMPVFTDELTDRKQPLQYSIAF